MLRHELGTNAILSVPHIDDPGEQKCLDTIVPSAGCSLGKVDESLTSV